MLGAVGLRAARRLGIPTVAVYQTDVAGFARQYGFLRRPVAVGRAHPPPGRPDAGALAASYAQLEALGVADVHLWRRGVSLDLFDPAPRRLRATWTAARGG